MTFWLFVANRGIVYSFKNLVPGVDFVQVESLTLFGAVGLCLISSKSGFELLDL